MQTAIRGRHQVQLLCWLLAGACLWGATSAAMAGSSKETSEAKPTPAKATRASASEARGYLIEVTPPSWVIPLSLEEALRQPATKSPLQVLLFDRQTRLGMGPSVDSYTRMVRRIDESAGLEPGSQWEVEFDPSYQKLVFHSLAVWRGSQRIDRLPLAQVKLLQRETQLERQIYDGRVTASIVMEDVRVGDRLELSYSLRGANPVFDGKWVDRDWAVSSRGPMTVYQQRLLVPPGRSLNVQADPALYRVQRRELPGGWQEQVVRRDNMPMWVWDPQLPYAETLPDQLWVSEFTSWSEVAKWAAGLFGQAARNAQGSQALRQQAEQLRQADPAASILAALTFVQTQVRYFGTEFGSNSHRPAEPERVLAQRFGDCKDKVSLLVALLRQMDIQATPLLVATDWRDGVSRLPPSPLAFNHAIVLVNLGEQSWVLDPTRNFQTGPLTERQSTGLGQGLPARDSAGLMALPSADQELRFEAQDLIRFDRIAEEPTLTSTVTYHGGVAEGVRAALADDRRRDVEKQVTGDLARAYARLTPMGEMHYEEVADHNAVRLTLRYRLPAYLRLTSDNALSGEVGLPLLMAPMRLADQTPRTRPMLLNAEGLYRERLRVEFPEEVFSRPAQTPAQDSGDRYTRLSVRQNIDRSSLDLSAELRVAAEPLPASQWVAHRDALLKAWPRLGGNFNMGSVEIRRRDALSAELKQLDEDLARGRLEVTTPEQFRARARLAVLQAQLAGSLLPHDVRRHLLVQQAMQQDHLGRLQAAQDSLQAAAALDPQDPEVLAAQAVNALLRHDDGEAVRRSQQVLSQNAQDVDSLMTLARARYYLGEFASASESALSAARGLSASERGYAAIWAYLSARRAGSDGRSALVALNAGSAGHWPDTWPFQILQALLDPAAEATAKLATIQEADGKKLGTADAAGRRCELSYYLGQLRLAEAQPVQARKLFEESKGTRVIEFVEHALATRELQGPPHDALR